MNVHGQCQLWREKLEITGGLSTDDVQQKEQVQSVQNGARKSADSHKIFCPIIAGETY